MRKKHSLTNRFNPAYSNAMQPKTYLQKQVVQLSGKIPPLNRNRMEWAFGHCLDHYGYFDKKTAVCFDCGHRWNPEIPLLLARIDGAHCPKCNTRLKPKASKQMFKDSAYFGIFTTCQTFQVYRIFWLQHDCRQGKPAERFCSEVVQHWITPEGIDTILAKSVNNMSMYMDQWRFASDLEIRSFHRRYNIFAYSFYPRQRFIPRLKRNGFDGNLHDIAPVDLFCQLLKNPKAELLLKSGQIPMLKKLCHSRISDKDLNEYWPAIKTCIRNKYLISDADTWCDQIRLLRYFNKDLSSPRYVCPANLSQEHQQLIKKRNRIAEREEQLEKQAKMQEEDLLYQKQKSPYLQLKFTDGEIQIRPLKSVREFYEEGRLLQHCVYTNSYYTKPDALILSAKISGQHVETVEVSLSQMKVIQSRGFQNKPTEYHEQIVGLVRKAIPKISTIRN